MATDRRVFVGKAVAAGVAWSAPMIVSSVALADAGTPKCRVDLSGLEIGLSVVAFNAVNLEFVPRTTAVIMGVANVCPCSAAPPAVSVRWTFTGPTGTPPPRLTRGGNPYNGQFQGATAGNRQIDISNDPADPEGNGNNNDLEVSGTYTVTATFRWRCAGVGPTQADACANRSITFNWNALGGTDVITGTPIVGGINRPIACGP